MRGNLTPGVKGEAIGETTRHLVACRLPFTAWDQRSHRPNSLTHEAFGPQRLYGEINITIQWRSASSRVQDTAPLASFSKQLECCLLTIFFWNKGPLQKPTRKSAILFHIFNCRSLLRITELASSLALKSLILVWIRIHYCPVNKRKTFPVCWTTSIYFPSSLSGRNISGMKSTHSVLALSTNMKATWN